MPYIAHINFYNNNGSICFDRKDYTDKSTTVGTPNYSEPENFLGWIISGDETNTIYSTSQISTLEVSAIVGEGSKGNIYACYSKNLTIK